MGKGIRGRTITAKWNRDLLDGWLWVEGDTESYTAETGYTVLKELNSFIGGLWFKQIWKIKAADPALVCGGGQFWASCQLEKIWRSNKLCC